jgi:hypothetical protein
LFRTAGLHNYINMLQCSLVFDKLAEGKSPNVQFEVNGYHYDKRYIGQVDGFYPPWATLVMTIERHVLVGDVLSNIPLNIRFTRVLTNDK